MKTGYKIMLGALAFVVTNVYAAEMMKKRTLTKSPRNTRKLALFPPLEKCRRWTPEKI